MKEHSRGEGNLWGPDVGPGLEHTSLAQRHRDFIAMDKGLGRHAR